MLCHGDEIKIQDTLKNLSESREKIVSKIDQLQTLLYEINQEYKLHSEHTISFANHISNYDGKVEKGNIIKEIDYKFWSIALDLSQVEKFISSKEKSDMKEKMHENPPEFNYTQAKNLVHSVMSSTEALATNLIKKIYSELTNTAFYAGNHYRATKQLKNKNKIEKSFRMSVFSRYGLPSYVRHNDAQVAVLQDLERVCYLVDGKLQPDSQGNIVTKLEQALRAKELVVNGDYFTLTMFKNGNVKVDFNDLDLVKKINLWGAKSNQLPDFSELFKKPA